jgi:hypothetical protein
MKNGKYTTAAGSTVELSGTNGGISRVTFDWLEEPEACSECDPNPYPEEGAEGRLYLTWYCNLCEGGGALLSPADDSPDDD